MKRFLLVFTLVGGLNIGAHAQENFHMPQASPGITIDQNFSTSFIKLDYSRPALRGREVFGEMIPYGELWRTGANASTKISFGEDVMIDGKALKAGTYSLYTIPGKKIWAIIFNTNLEHWGTEGFNDNETALKLTAPVKTLDKKQENFEIQVENITKNSADIVISWENTSVAIPVKANNNQRIMAHLDKVLKGDKPPYASAANYYLSTDQKLDDALKYINLAIEESPDAFYLYWSRAKIYQKLGKHEEAVKSAKMAAEKAKSDAAFAGEYERHYQNMLKKN